MQLNDFTIQVATAHKGLQPATSGQRRTLLGDIITDNGPVRAYVKLLNLGDIAKEALCAVLARTLHLPVPRPFYVQADPAVTGHDSGNSIHLAFALEEEVLTAPRIRNAEVFREQILLWPDVIGCAAFDSWIANRDRVPNNLLFAGNQQFWMIDHEEALPSYLGVADSDQPQLIQLLAEGKSEHELHQLRQKLLRVAEGFKSVNWEELSCMLRQQDVPELSNYFDGHISFLRTRTSHMSEVFAKDLGLLQTDLDFPHVDKDSSEIKL